MMGMAEDRGALRVLVTSVDGNADHPFRDSQTIGDVRSWAYKQLVRDKSATSLDATWIDFKGNRVDDSVELGSLEREETKTGKDPDLVLSLSWTSQGGFDSQIGAGKWMSNTRKQ